MSARAVLSNSSISADLRAQKSRKHSAYRSPPLPVRHAWPKPGCRITLALRHAAANPAQCERAALMTPGRWKSLELLFHQVVGLPPSERDGVLSTVEAGLREEIERLLAADAQGAQAV